MKIGKYGKLIIKSASIVSVVTTADGYWHDWLLAYAASRLGQIYDMIIKQCRSLVVIKQLSVEASQFGYKPESKCKHLPD